MTALKVYGVFAPEKRTVKAVNCGWYRGRNAFRPDDGMMGFFIFYGGFYGLDFSNRYRYF